MNIEQLVNDYPNDMELGKKVRELYLEARKFQDNLSEKIKSNARNEPDAIKVEDIEVILSTINPSAIFSSFLL